MTQEPYSPTTGGDFRPDPPDPVQMQIFAHLPAARRVRVMLDARELAVGLIRGRLRRRYPDLAIEALNLKVLEEIDRGEQRKARF